MSDFTTWRSLVDGEEIGVIPDAVVEDFERSNPLDDYSGDLTNYSVQSTTTFEGDNALIGENRAGEIISTSGLDAYPQAGEIFSYRTRIQGDRPISVGLFGVQDTDNYYGAYINKDELRLLKDELGGALDDSAISIATDIWYLIRVYWDVDGNDEITVELWEDEPINERGEGTLVDSVTATDAEYKTGGIGFFNFHDQNSPGESFWDYWIIE